MVKPVSMSLSSAYTPSFYAKAHPSTARISGFSNAAGIVSEKRPRAHDLTSWTYELRKQKLLNDICELEKNGGSKLEILLKKALLWSGMY